jgi:histidinol-phosphate aminotransferase
LKVCGEKWLEEKLARMRSAEDYNIEEPVESVGRRFGISPSAIVKLNSNENLFIPKGLLLRLMRNVTGECDPRIYPQEEECKLKEKLGVYMNVPSDRIVIGGGSDQLIELIARLLLEKGDCIFSVRPTFPMYRRSASILGARCLEASLNEDFSLNVEVILRMITPSTRVLFLCSPNNPTANQFAMSDIRLLLEEFPGVAVVDEAYMEFAEYSLSPLLEKFENLIILRTFSKAFGLAGFRLGYCSANPDLAVVLSKKMQLPYPASSVALRMGLKMLTNVDVVEKAVERLKVERWRLIRQLNEVQGVKAFDSQTNFVLFQTDRPCNEIYQGLLTRGVLIKKLGRILELDNCFRTTVGLPEMNAQLLDCLRQIGE